MKKSDLIEDIVQHHRVVNRVFTQYSPDAWMGINLTIAQVKSLFFIADEGSVNFRKLASAMKVTPSNVTGIIDRLVEQGLVTRNENPDDRRMLMLELTEKGQTLITNLREKRSTQISTVLDSMTEDELSAVAKGFGLLRKAVENTPDHQ